MIQEINSIMKILFKHTRLFTLLLTLLLLGGMANEAWAYKVRYHILTLPFDVPNYNGSNPKWRDDIRVEALLVVVNNADKVGLPEEYKSPLATGFTYYSSWTSSYDYLYDYNNNSRLLQVKYNLYSESGKGSVIDVGTDINADTDIYVTYVINTAYADGHELFLDGSQDYNIGVGERFLCYNRSRNNRLGNANSPAITGEHLVSQEFVVPQAGTGTNQLGFNWSNDQWAGPKGVHMGFWFTGYKNEGKIVKDPYNITIMTAYNGNETYAKDPVDGDNNKMYVKPYKGATLFSKMISQDDGKGTEDKMWFDCDDHVHYKGVPGSAGIDDPTSENYWAKQVDQWPGFYRHSQQPVFNSVAILNRPGGGYVFVASKLNQGVGNDAYKEWAPNKNNNYPTLTDANLNPKMVYKALGSSPIINIYKIRTYTFKIKTHVSEVTLTADMRWSDAKASDKIVDLIPETLKRKYCSYKAYTDEALTNEISTFEDAINSASVVDGKKVIWLKYETNMPFETSATSATYDDLKWYNFYVNKSSRNSAYWDGSKIKTSRDLSKYGRSSHFAFIGDPYDLQIVCRKAIDNASGTFQYMKLADPISGNAGFANTGTTWGIVYDDNTADFKDCFRLKDNSSNTYLHQNTSTDNPLNGIATLSDAVCITVSKLPNKNYIYYIMRNDGDKTIAVMSQAFHEPSAKLSFDHIPSTIRSPFIKGVPLHFYGGYTASEKGEYTSGEERVIAEARTGSPEKEIIYSPDIEKGDIQYIVVRYDFNGTTSPTNFPKINGESSATFNVRLNSQYIYYDKNEDVIKSSAEIITGDATKEYSWTLGGSDPYALTIKPSSVSKYIAIQKKEISTGVYDIDWPHGDEEGFGKEITWSESAPDSKYIIKSSTDDDSYEVMGATGLSYEAMEETFNFGRPADNTVKMYSDWSYLSGSDVLRFELIKNSAVDVTYHLIDKTDHVLLSVQTRQDPDATPSFPAEYRSPLVGKYHYWISSNFNIDIVSGKYTLKESQTEINKVSSGDLDGFGVRNIYVTYEANDLVDMSGKTMYLLKYALGDTFNQEDGSDGVSTTAQKAVYPYCNGDCNFFVYGQEQYDIQQQSAASTRTRWAWYVESVNNDPYHVKIRSRQQETYPAGSENNYNAFFRTYKPNGYSEVVTTLAWPGISGEQGTEYMVLGSTGQFRLVTTYGIDLNNDGDRSDTGEDVRRAVNSFEQYWKTWNTIRLNVLGDKDAVAKQSDPNTVPETPATKTATDVGKNNRTYLTDVMKWHSYEQWAYAIRWNDYNKNGDKNKKGWESIEHWYQTVKMGEGYFNFVPTTIDPVLILLDQHGWEVMRKPLPSSPTDPDMTAKYDAIRPYDSPMVKEYHFWTKTSKRSGFHQYHTLSQRVTVDGKPFTSTSLTSLPPFDATNVHDAKGNLYDQYVTYTVKDEYLKACNVTLSYTEGEVDPADSKKTYSKVTANVTGVPFLIQQGDHFVSATGETTLKNDNAVPATGGMSQYIIENVSNLTTTGSKKNELWYLMPNLNIDNEMGYDVTAIPAHNWASDYDRKDKVQTSGFNSWAFDPYNIQISSVAYSSSYFVTNATTAEVHEGSILGNGATNALGDKKAVKAALVGGWDNRTIQMTNATFMAVQDKNGNMQLMPRFDQEKRLKDFSTLVHTDDPDVAQTYTKLYRPLVYNYHIIDNSGSESLRYQGGGDLVPQTPAWFKSPLAKDYKYYFGHAAYTESTSSKASYDAAASSNYFQKTADSESAMKTAANELTVLDDYYFKIVENEPYTYKKVTVTKAHSGSTDATYTTAICTEADWTNAVVKSRTEVANQAAMRTAVDALTTAGTYYYELTSPSGTYMKVVVKSGSSDFPDDVAAKNDISDKEITGSLAGADLDATSSSNDVYVRYSYDEEADNMGILKGKWLTMTLNAKNAVYSDGVKQASVSKPDPVNASHKDWQWKFLANSQTTPDPYAVSLYNRNNTPGEPTSVNSKTKFALLNWYDNTGVDPNAYTLAVHGTGTSGYYFVNGASMNTTTAATTNTESGVKSTSCSYTNTAAKIELNDEVVHNFAYRIYTNEAKFAVSATQENNVVVENDYVPVLPEEIKSPLLNMDQFCYYDKAHFTFDNNETLANIMEADTTGKALNNLYGIYDDIVIVRYAPYNLKKTEYKVPNVRNTPGTTVARDESSNDAALDINDELLYNIIWYEDKMMSASGTTISDGGAKVLDGATPYVWKFEGNDPYAIKIKHNNSNIYKYAVGTDALAETATSTFMLLPYTYDNEWEYGMLQVTGGTNKLSGYGQTTVAADPKKFIIFGLSTHTVIYHLLIAKTCTDTTNPKPGEYIDIPYREPEGLEVTTKRIYGSSQRDLTSKKDDDEANPVGSKYQLGETLYGVNYCVNEGHITLGDPLKVPDALKRPNCKYFYYVEGVYTDEDCSRAKPYGTEGTHIDALDAQYRGLQITQMGTEPELLGKTVRINVEYQFDDGLPTNNGSDFVTNTSGTQWYTFETNDETPYLANFTYKDNKLQGKKGRIGHYTNEFLWSPVGDPYGFKMSNRYVYKNGTEDRHDKKVMTTESAPADDADLIMAEDASLSKPVYELLPGETAGYFKVQTLTIPESGTPYYIDNSSGVITLQTSTDTEWTFGLSDALLEPYYLGAGNVGGLTTEAKPGQDKSGVKRYEEAANLIEKQSVVFNPVNIVDFTPGYYRIFSEPNSLGIKIPRYLSGYTHKTELTSAIPMHFYEKKGVTTTFEALGSGFTTTAATQGQIPIVAPEYDPASIFYITGTNPETPSTAPYYMQTQGLYVDGAVMATSAGTNSKFHVLDIGGAVVLLHDGAAAADRQYLHYKQDTDIYDVKFEKGTVFNDDDAARWCMEPANKLGLYIETHSGGEEEVLTTTWYYSTYCVPFDMLIANKTEDEAHSSNAYTCVETESPWPTTEAEARIGLHPKSIGKYNTGTYKDNDYFVPAGTPVIFSTKRATEYIKATIPTTAPSASISTIFSAKYLEQTLPGWNNDKRVYVFGPKMQGTISINTSNGDVNATLPSLGNTNVGFHLNANPNKETGLMPASWTRNNYYVLHNRIYYIANVTPSAGAKATEFVPLIFDFDEDMEEEEEMKAKPQTVDVSDDKVYDLQGRCIAIGEDVLDGSWRNNVAPGLYIIGGKKIYVGK